MSNTTDEYRCKAAEAEAMARLVSYAPDKARLLASAQEWRRIADAAVREHRDEPAAG